MAALAVVGYLIYFSFWTAVAVGLVLTARTLYIAFDQGLPAALRWVGPQWPIMPLSVVIMAFWFRHTLREMNEEAKRAEAARIAEEEAEEYRPAIEKDDAKLEALLKEDEKA